MQPAKTISTKPPGKNTSDYTLKTASPAGNPLPAPVTTENFVVQSYKILVPDSAPNPASPDQSPQNSQNTEEIVLNVPPGMPAPVVFLDTSSYSPQIQRKLYEIAKEFETNVSTPIEGISPQELWSFALSLADEQYIKILGFEAYNYLHLEARREALREKRLLEKSTPPPDPNTPTN